MSHAPVKPEHLLFAARFRLPPQAIFVSAAELISDFPQPLRSQFQVEQLDENGEAHGEVSVAFRDVKTGAFRDEVHADEQKKT